MQLAKAGNAVTVTVTGQFRGPPNSGNGGYVCGLLSTRVEGGVVTGVLRAPIPLDTPLRLATDAAGVARLTGAAGELIAEARASAAVDLPTPPPAPSLGQAIDAGRGFIGLVRTFHPVCFTCGVDEASGYGLRVFVGALPGHTPGVVAGVWTVHEAFVDDHGLARPEAVWGALDCPGSVAWVETGDGGGLLGTMTCEMLRRPRAGETCIVLAWPIEASGRKRVAGTALFSADGVLMARSRQIWIGRVAET